MGERVDPEGALSRSASEHARVAYTILQGFSATIPDSFLGQLQSLQGDLIEYIGAYAVSSPTQADADDPRTRRARPDRHHPILNVYDHDITIASNQRIYNTSISV